MVYVKINYEAKKASKTLVVFITVVFSALPFYLRQDFYTPSICLSHFLYYESARDIVAQYRNTAHLLFDLTIKNYCPTNSISKFLNQLVFIFIIIDY